MSVHPIWPVLLVGLVGTGWALWRLRRTRDRAGWRRLGLAVLVLLIGVRPVVGSAAGDAAASTADVVIVIDRTTSMGALDHADGKPRMDGVRSDVRAVVKRFPGARFALVTFDSGARVEMPLSSDAGAVVTLADTIIVQNYTYSAGSSISRPVELLTGMLAQAQKAAPERQRYVVYLGDGEQTSDETPGSFAELKPFLAGGVVLGYGTVAGGRMPTGYGRDNFVYDPAGHGDALSKIDEGNLRTIADQLGVGYQHRTGDTSALQLNPKRTALGLGDGRVHSGVETYWVFALGLLGLALWELWRSATAYARLREELR
ncbi:VWA domain-containing protein [Naumannella sp. ID2617S]|nr:VWA domain-containing protein [Naumannella sp. ID2617S]